jgi:hypothetical protein
MGAEAADKETQEYCCDETSVTDLPGCSPLLPSYRTDAAMLPPSTVSTAAVVLSADAR